MSKTEVGENTANREEQEVLTGIRVEEIFKECLAGESEDQNDGQLIEGIVHDALFNRERVQKNAAEIFTLLLELPPEFMASGEGKGYSFLYACLDKHGRHWTDFHLVMEELLMLGLAIEKVKILMPRKLWSVLPGGMPYFAVLDLDKN